MKHETFLDPSCPTQMLASLPEVSPTYGVGASMLEHGFMMVCSLYVWESGK